MIPLLLLPAAFATAGFDPTAPQAVFNGEETYTEDGTIRLWAEIARYDDPDRTLFGDVSYNDLTRWPENDFYSPWIAACFGTQEPASSSFLLHVGPSLALATGTPILFVPGAGDNASRGFVTMAAHMDIAGRPVFAVTFPQPHGDVYQQAELIADAVAVVKARTGAAQVDVVSHSKGGIATAVYLSNHPGTAWDDGPYEAVSTPYDGSVRRAVLIATPLAGIDTSFRWPSGNLLSLDADEAFSPSSWARYYPYTVATYWVSTPLADQDFLPDGRDLFPGHRQILARQDYPLPGEQAWLGAYAAQVDWYTSYEGGLGYYSDSDGIDAAIDAGGHLLDKLADAGVDPSVELYLLAGENALMPNASQWLWTAYFGEAWADQLTASAEQWSVFLGRLVDDGLLAVGVAGEEVQGVASGALVLGEISGPSDGLVFVTSATAGERLTARGAEVVESKVVNLSHLDLLYASPITGQLLIDDAATDEAKAWEAALGERYVDADTIGWVEHVLEDPSTGSDTGEPPDSGDSGDSGGDSGDTAADSGEDGADSAPADSGTPEDDDDGDEQATLGCGTCSTGASPTSWIGTLLALGALVAARRRE